MRMLATGQNCLPEGGIGAVAEQLGGRLAADSLFLGERWQGPGHLSHPWARLHQSLEPDLVTI
jgi:hypothetical protein